MDPKILEAFDNAPQVIKDLILNKEEEASAVWLGEKYKLHIDSLVHLKDLIVLILLGQISTEEVFTVMTKELKIDDITAYSIAEDLDKTIFQKARIAVLGKELAKPKDEVKTIKLGENGDSNKENLREQITNINKRDPTANRATFGKFDDGKKLIVNGSRDQLMEQLEILGTIPTDDFVEGRLKDIKEKIGSINKKIEEQSEITDTAKEFFDEVGNMVVEPTPRVAPYSKAPIHYNVDPYRELSEE